MVGLPHEGYSNEIDYYLIHQHRIFRAYIHELEKVDTLQCFEAASRLSLHTTNFKKSIEVSLKLLKQSSQDFVKSFLAAKPFV